jgi:peptidoglycan/LPS O-acetylase OafA/YrhL
MNVIPTMQSRCARCHFLNIQIPSSTPEVDGLRGLLALYVLLTHTMPWVPLPVVLTSPLAHGEAAVDLFFVLSGLVIAAWVEHFDYRAAPFLIARMARIFPAFLPVFALAVIVQPVAIDFTALPWIGPTGGAHELRSDGWPPDWSARIAAHLVMLHGLFLVGVLPDVWVSFLGSAWSLSTEFQFYALVALIGAGSSGGLRDHTEPGAGACARGRGGAADCACEFHCGLAQPRRRQGRATARAG